MNRIRKFTVAALVAVLTVTACDEGTPPPVEPPPPPTPVGTISGAVTIEGTAATGITATLSSGATTTTGSGGNFAFSGVEAGTYTVTISGFPEDATFAQVTQSATIATDGQNVQLNFAGEYIRSSAVVGNVVAADAMMSGGDGQPETLAGVTVALGGEHAMGETMETDMSGGFAFTGLRAGTYTVTISNFPEDVSFEVVSMEIEVEVGEVGQADFTGNFIRTSAVEGQVIIEGEGLAGVTVTLSGGPVDESYTMMTDADGMYRFEELRPGSYMVSISDFDTRDYEFAATSQDVSVDLDETGTVSFTGVLLRTSGISGRVSVEGMGLADITVTLAGGEDRTAMTDAGGQYAFAGLAAGSYTVSIAVEGAAYVFDAMSSDVTLGDDESAIVSFEGAHARTASVSGMAFIDEATKNDMYDDGEHPVAHAGLAVALVGPGVNEQRTAVTDATGAFSFTNLRAGAYQLVALVDGPVAAALAAADLAYGGSATGYAFALGVGEAKSQNLPFDITHTTVNFTVSLRSGDETGDALPSAMVRLYADADGDDMVGSGETGEDGSVAIRVARADADGNMVYASVSSADADVADGMTKVEWNPQSNTTAATNSNDIVNLNVEVAISGATVTRGDMGGEPLGGWAISVTMGEGDDAEAVEGAPGMLGEDGTGSLTTMVESAPATFTFAVAVEEVDGEKIASEAVDYTHTGLSLAGGEVALEAMFATQTLVVYTHHEVDQVAGYTGDALLGGDVRMSGMVDIEIRHISGSFRAVRFTDADSIVSKDSEGVWTFSNVPSDAKVLVIATPADDSHVQIVGDDEVAAYGDDANVKGGLFGENGGWSSKVEVPSFAFVKTYPVNGQVWKNGVKPAAAGDGFVMHTLEGDNPMAQAGVTVSLGPVEGRNLVNEGGSHTTTEKDDKDTEDVDETKGFDFGRMADGAYEIRVPAGWEAKNGEGGDALPKLFTLSEEADRGESAGDEDGDTLNIDVTPSTGVVYGRVEDRGADDIPLEGVRVTVNGVEADDLTDRHGRYIVDGYAKRRLKFGGSSSLQDALVVEMAHKGEVAHDTVAHSFTANDPKEETLGFEGAAQVATISGKVTQSGSDRGLGGVQITVEGDGIELSNPNAKSTGSRVNDIYRTRADGTYSVEVTGAPAAPGSETVTVTAVLKGMTFTPPFHPVSVSAGTSSPSRHFTAFEYGTITGRVRDASTKAGVRYITVEAANGTVVSATAVTGSTGAFRLSVPFGSYEIRLPSNSGYTFEHNGQALAAVTTTGVDNRVTLGIRTVAPGQTLSLGTINATRNDDQPAPVFTSGGTFSVEERKTAIGVVRAIDPLGAASPTYGFALASDNTGGTGSSISIDPNTGALTFDNGPAYNSAAKAENVYTGTVTATIGGASATQAVKINVTDVKDPVVTFKVTPVEIAENGGETVVTATASKAFERTVFVTVQFEDAQGTTIQPGPNGPFSVSGDTRLVFVKGQTSSEGSLTLTANNNNTDAPNDVVVTVTADETAFFTANGVRVESFKDAKLTIKDDDVP